MAVSGGAEANSSLHSQPEKRREWGQHPQDVHAGVREGHMTEGCRMLLCSMTERLADATRFSSKQKQVRP